MIVSLGPIEIVGLLFVGFCALVGAVGTAILVFRKLTTKETPPPPPPVAVPAPPSPVVDIKDTYDESREAIRRLRNHLNGQLEFVQGEFDAAMNSFEAQNQAYHPQDGPSAWVVTLRTSSEGDRETRPDTHRPPKKDPTPEAPPGRFDRILGDD